MKEELSIHEPANAVIYARSAMASPDSESSSLQRQRHICDDYAKAHNIEIAGVFEDNGVNGLSANRQGLNDMIEAVALANPKISIVLCEDISRIARSLPVFQTIQRKLSEHGCMIFPVGEHRSRAAS